MSADFLVEIGTEELPPKALKTLSEAFKSGIVSAFQKEELGFQGVSSFATPRRLAVVVEQLDEQLPTKEFLQWGPPVKVAFSDDGSVTKAGLAFAEKNGIAVEDLRDYIANDGTQDKLCKRIVSEGGFTQGLLDRVVIDALEALPIPKRMHWGAKRDEFVRPVHWVVLLFADKTWNYPVLGVTAGNVSMGHRFHSTGPITIQSPSSYADDLRKAHVIADFEERKALIRQGVTEAAESAGGHAVIDEHLLDEVTALNEWPVPLVGSFEQRFLEVPPEALISSMKEHQKYFHVVDAQGQLMPLFVTVSNIASREPERVIAGNEKVIRPRLADAAFFYDTDKQHSLASRREQLKSIVFQEKLGTLYDKTERIADLGAYLAPAVGADPERVRRAAELCKSDLVSEMVMEFDDLQGIMGRYYAQHDGEPADVAEAMIEQYFPAFAGDRLPETATGTAIALADRLDTLVGIFGIGQPPTGSRDPFALRRASLGILRILVEKAIDLPLLETLRVAAGRHTGLSVTEGLDKQVLTYLLERFRAWYEEDGIDSEVFLAVQAKALDNPLDFHLRVQAVHRFSRMPEASALAAANKRVSNILAKAEGALPPAVDQSLFDSEGEKALLASLESVAAKVTPLVQRRKYSEAMQSMAALKSPVDDFFDQVMVMADDSRIRNNRLALLRQLRDLFLQIADISLLAAK
ncbi:MAG: glycine--tRNA ligase subunit beta [Porticoccaceae bacterium]|nr:glycine--tRNA ligase subunit beta [Porticoccaceae bacterium]